jgi:hypothetical protein
MTEEDSSKGSGKLQPIDKPKSGYGKLTTTEPEQKTEKPAPSIPPVPESKSEEFWKGYDEGYKEAKAGKKPRAHS